MIYLDKAKEKNLKEAGRFPALVSVGTVKLLTTAGNTASPAAAAAKSLQSCPTLCDPIDGSPRGSPVPGILQARTLEWVQQVLTGLKSAGITHGWQGCKPEQPL